MADPDCLDIYDDAEFYDREFRDREFDVGFWCRRAQRAAGEVLEIACGTGRITLPIARAGVTITGLDVSTPMLELARLKARREGLNVEWVSADCRDFSIPKKFRMIFIAANAMQHLLDIDSVMAFLHCARRHLEPGGELFVDVFNPDVVKLSRPPSVRYLHKQIPGIGDDHAIRVEASSTYDAANQRLRFTLDYFDRGDRPLRTKHVTMRCFFPLELELLCRHGGWTILDKFGSYAEEPFVASSPKQILVCRPA